jgi:hypothetical protein
MALSAYEKILIDDLNKLTEELKTRNLSVEEQAALRKIVEELCDLPGVLPEE